MTAYYNEIDPYAAQWLRNLICAGLIAAGDVDERDVREVQPDDLRGYEQCHLFAGIGGWSYALRLAGWPDDRPAWTGSCPCQPFSSAGRGQGHADQRHLWPAFFRLIDECRPAVVFGEQVASALGREWLAGVRADLEHVGYACGCADLPAACVGAPHIRQRLWWVADANDGRCGAGGIHVRRARQDEATPVEQGLGGRLGDASVSGDGALRGQSGTGAGPQEPAGGSGLSCRLGDAYGHGSPERAGVRGVGSPAGVGPSRGPAEPAGAWSEYDLIPCADGKARRVESGIQPLAHRLPRSFADLSSAQRRVAAMAGCDGASLRRAKTYRVRSLRAYGNAIVPQVAAVFIEAFIGSRGGERA